MIFQSPTPALSETLDFYKKLQFHIIENDEGAFVTDQNAIIKVNTERTARAGVILYRENWEEEIRQLQSVVTISQTEKGYIITDSTGVWIYLNNGSAPIFDFNKEHRSILGNYAGLSMETLSMENSLKLWEILGFKTSMGGVDQGWIAMTDKAERGISLMKANMCPHLFHNPSLTYFNSGKNPEVIQKIRHAEVSIAEEITVFNKEGIVDNVILKDPGGFGFFVFND